MQVSTGTIVTFHYTLKDETGLELETNRNEAR